MTLDNQHFFVTGACGPTGSWVLKTLIGRGAKVTAFDGENDDRRLRLIQPWAEQGDLRRVVGDVADLTTVVKAMKGATHVIHLTRSAPQPATETATTAIRRIVGGGLTVIEAGRRCGVSALVYDLPGDALGTAGPPLYPKSAGDPGFENLLAYAAYQLWTSCHIPTAGIRVGGVYGAGQNEGRMSTLTETIAAAVRNVPLAVPTTEPVSVHYVADVATALVEAATRVQTGATVIDLPGHHLRVDEFVAIVQELTGNETVQVHPERSPADALPPPETAGAAPNGDGVHASGLTDLHRTAIRDGVRGTLELLRWAPEDLYPALTVDR